MIPRNTIADKINSAQRELQLLQKQKETLQKEKDFKYPSKWARKLKGTKRKNNSGKVLVMYLNKQGDMEVPVFLPVFDGNMIIYKNKPYEYDPRALYTVKGFKGSPRTLLLKESDRKPIRNKEGKLVYINAEVTNQEIEEIRARGDSTEHDEFLLKFLLRASQSATAKKINVGVMVIMGIIIVGVIIYLMSSS